MLRGVREVLIRAQEHEVVPDAELGNQRIDGANLNASPATGVAQTCRSDVVLSVGLNQRTVRGENDSGFRRMKSLEAAVFVAGAGVRPLRDCPETSCHPSHMGAV